MQALSYDELGEITGSFNERGRLRSLTITVAFLSPHLLKFLAMTLPGHALPQGRRTQLGPLELTSKSCAWVHLNYLVSVKQTLIFAAQFRTTVWQLGFSYVGWKLRHLKVKLKSLYS